MTKAAVLAALFSSVGSAALAQPGGSPPRLRPGPAAEPAIRVVRTFTLLS